MLNVYCGVRLLASLRVGGATVRRAHKVWQFDAPTVVRFR